MHRSLLTISLCLILLLSTVLPGTSLQPLAKAGNGKKSDLKNAEIWRQFALILSDDENVVYAAKRELIAMGSEILPYVMHQLSRLDDDSSVISGFILGELDDPAVLPMLIEILESSKFKGDDASSSTEGGGGNNQVEVENGDGSTTTFSVNVLSERARAYRDGFCCLALGLQAQKLDMDDPKQAALHKKSLEVLRNVLPPEMKNMAFAKVGAILGMGLLGDQSSIPYFTAMAVDEEEHILIRVSSLLILSAYPSEESRKAMEAVASVLPENERDWKQVLLLKNATLGLGNMNSPESIPILMNCIACKESAVVRMHAWLSIGEIGVQDTLDSLKDALQGETDPRVLCSAARAMWLLGDYDTAYFILEKVFADNTLGPRRQVYATQILGSFTDERAKDMLLRLLNHRSMHVQRLAASNLVKFSFDTRVSATLADLAANRRTDKTTRQQAALAFMNTELSDRNLIILKKLAAEKDPDLKRVAALALANRSQSSDIIKLMKRFCTDRNLLVRTYASIAYGTTVPLNDEETNLKPLKALIRIEPSHMVHQDAMNAYAALKTNNHLKLSETLESFAMRESLAPKYIWEQFWQHQFELVFASAIQEAAGSTSAEDSVSTEIVEVPGEEVCEDG